MKKVALAFSGGLDTSFCVPYLREELGADIITVTVNTGGFTQEELEHIRHRSVYLGAVKHYSVNAEEEFFNRILRYLIAGNTLRGGTYPLSAGAERVLQAEHLYKVAQEEGADAVAHGCTGAGNDQVRFDVALNVLSKGKLKIIAPIRQLDITRDKEVAFLMQRGYDVPVSAAKYSINKGLWGTTIGGAETHFTNQYLPEEAFPSSSVPLANDETIDIYFDRGVPVKLNSQEMSPVKLVKQLNRIGESHRIGRGMHLGRTTLGFKGRVAFEAPAAAILIAAHRELEKLVLTDEQQHAKNYVAELYCDLLHKGHYYDPVMRDIEAFLDSSQRRVRGDVTMQLYRLGSHVLGCSSSCSLFEAGRNIAVYGERTQKFYDGRDAEGFSKIIGIEDVTSRIAEPG